MEIKIRGASEHNLKSLDVDIGDGLTVVTGVSGSGKTSLVFDTMYHEARRRFLEVFSTGSQSARLAPANVQSVTGIGPAIAVGQNLLNRNPFSTLATASGLHPFLRLLYARFGTRHCPRCDAAISVLTEDEIVEKLLSIAKQRPVKVLAPLVRGVKGSHRTLLKLLVEQFGREAVLVDGRPWRGRRLNPVEPHNIEVEVARFKKRISARHVREAVQSAAALGADAIRARTTENEVTFARVAACVECGTWFGDLEPVHFHTSCPYCKGKGCDDCAYTGLYPRAASVRWQRLRLTELLALSVDEARSLFASADLVSSAARLRYEIERRLESLLTVGLGYIQLNRPSPTLSRGESQRVRLAVSLTSRLEDILHVLDEPTIGQHPVDVARLLPAFRKLLGPVVYVEHDRMAASAADRAIDIGPAAGDDGGRIVFTGMPAELWETDTATGRYFSFRERVPIPEPRPEPKSFLVVHGACKHNLKNIDVQIPLGRLTVITGVSGSGKSTLVEEVLVPSLKKNELIGCIAVEGPEMKPILVDQSPIGKNPRSNPATYTKLSDIVRDLFADVTGLSPSHFSFNRPEGACPRCKGIGAVEVRMRYLPSTWIPCSDCDGQRFSDEVLSKRVSFLDRNLSIADFYKLSIAQVSSLLAEEDRLSAANRKAAKSMLDALGTVGLGYLRLGQPSPTLSGGEAQRVKLAKYLGKRSLSDRLLILDEPSTGLHPKDLAGLLEVLDRLVRAGATIIIVEHNTDIMRAADWIVDLGPGAGPKGGKVIYAGPPGGLTEIEESFTGRALREEASVRPRAAGPEKKDAASEYISIRNAQANNLKGVDVDFLKSAITVVTGVSGSGKSSLVRDILESEARRRFLETLSVYERQGTHEGPEAPAESVTGLGVSVPITPTRRLYQRRSTVGTATEILHHMAVLLASIGERICLKCGTKMARRDEWECPRCHATAPIAKPRHFSSSNYYSACPKCHGVGTLQIPVPEKLIIKPDKPLCGGAMYSPGFFPKGYLCKPYNGGYYVIQALAERYGFDPAATPWNEMTPEAQKAFLFGDPEPLTVTFESRRRPPRTHKLTYRGYYGDWIRDWDVGGTYTKTQPCDRCNGTGFKPEYLAVTLGGYNIHELSEMPLYELVEVLKGVSIPEMYISIVDGSLRTILKRLRFLLQVGLGYLHLNRVSGTLSAGEAQRVKLAGLLGSGLTSLTVLLDEPSRGMHPSEVEALLDALRELRDEGNTVIVVEHDPVVIQAADQLVDMGPGAGVAGGRIVAVGKPHQVAKGDTLTAKWLRGERRINSGRRASLDLFDFVAESSGVKVKRRKPKGWLTIRGAKANNLRGETIRVPLGVLVGICGVSGSGKSTLLIDTVGRALAPKKITTSVAHEPMDPGEHDSIEGAPKRTILLDQAPRGIRSPGLFLDIFEPLLRIFAESDDAKALGLDQKELSKRCSVCGGVGSIRMDMGFLPDVHTVCETCRGTGRRPEAWDVRVKGVAFPELGGLTIDEVYDLFGDDETLERKLIAAKNVGLGYLVLRQPGYTLSGGEAQRLRIAKDLSRKMSSETLYVLDEPTVGQHMEDVDRLIGVLHRLVDEGHSVVVIEHHPHLLAACDWLIELGPRGGPEGGYIIASGTPETVADSDTLTAPYLGKVLEGKL
ncbi:MAG: ATP-binding cassette domain-containing protein [Candidatus Bathyarchaeota archaeon]|nr:ATP-binding cassette domain-containing protein [Candidatus Bathyarchaeota archaeon]